MGIVQERPRVRLPPPGRYRLLFHGGGFDAMGWFLGGTIYGVTPDGRLAWHRFRGFGLPEVNGPGPLWEPNTRNVIRSDFAEMKVVVGCGGGVMMAVDAVGDLRWYRYEGRGARDPNATAGWKPGWGNPIGNGWGDMLHVFVNPWEGGVTVYGVTQTGDLHWYSYNGTGVKDRTGHIGWKANTGNIIAQGWHIFRRVVGTENSIYVVHQDGSLWRLSYRGSGERDLTGTRHWHEPARIAEGWGDLQQIAAGQISTPTGFWDVILTVDRIGELRWHAYVLDNSYRGVGWHPRSRTRLEIGW